MALLAINSKLYRCSFKLSFLTLTGSIISKSRSTRLLSTPSSGLRYELCMKTEDENRAPPHRAEFCRLSNRYHRGRIHIPRPRRSAAHYETKKLRRSLDRHPSALEDADREGRGRGRHFRPGCPPARPRRRAHCASGGAGERVGWRGIDFSRFCVLWVWVRVRVQV